MERLRKTISIFFACLLFVTAILAIDCQADAAKSGKWVELPGKAIDIGIGANGAVWVVGTDKYMNDWSIHRWNGAVWEKIQGAATRISVDSKGNAWVVNSLQDLYAWDGSSEWIDMKIKAMDIGLGADGTAWVIGSEKVGADDWSIHRLGANGWERMPGGGVGIDVDEKGNAFVVNSLHDMYRWNGAAWDRIAGKATDVGIGANGKVWVIGVDKTGEDGGIHRMENNHWRKTPGEGYRIDVDPAGFPWIVKSDTSIVRWSEDDK
ncbi:MAG: tectonin domain-containing protein [bacterium]